jgi:hypothetical protein
MALYWKILNKPKKLIASGTKASPILSALHDINKMGKLP